MENLQIILSTVGTAVGLLITTLTFLTKYISNAKARKTAEEVIQIEKVVLTFIEQAEKFTNYTGAEKKDFVITKANQYAIAKGLNFNTESVSEKIEEIVALTKNINKREKDKICAATSANAAEYAECMCGQPSEQQN